MVLAFVVLVIARTASPGGPGPSGAASGALAAATPAASPTASAGATLSPSPTASPTASPSPSPAATPSATPVPSGIQRYTVVSGDTLSVIAARFGTTVAALAAANGITDPRLIRPGQVLVIP
jgi:LysM repeat protein